MLVIVRYDHCDALLALKILISSNLHGDATDHSYDFLFAVLKISSIYQIMNSHVISYEMQNMVLFLQRLMTSYDV